MRINESTRVSEETQKEVAAYGLVRKRVMQDAPPKETGTPNFFGIRFNGDSVDYKFDTSIAAIQDDEMTVALAAPENESFNMLVTTDFDKAKEVGTEDEMRAYLRRIVDRA